jgi:hypothetical protein
MAVAAICAFDLINNRCSFGAGERARGSEQMHVHQQWSVCCHGACGWRGAMASAEQAVRSGVGCARGEIGNEWQCVCFSSHAQQTTDAFAGYC